MSDAIPAPISPERVIELLKCLPPRTGRPFSNDEHLKAACIVGQLLLDCEINPSEQRGIALTLARINTP
jgi:hypothetical protein